MAERVFMLLWVCRQQQTLIVPGRKVWLGKVGVFSDKTTPPNRLTGTWLGAAVG